MNHGDSADLTLAIGIIPGFFLSHNHHCLFSSCDIFLPSPLRHMLGGPFFCLKLEFLCPAAVGQNLCHISFALPFHGQLVDIPTFAFLTIALSSLTSWVGILDLTMSFIMSSHRAWDSSIPPPSATASSSSTSSSKCSIRKTIVGQSLVPPL